MFVGQFVSTGPPDQMKNDTDMKFGEHTTLGIFFLKKWRRNFPKNHFLIIEFSKKTLFIHILIV